MNDNSQADICNQEEYNKIFRPNKEIKRRKSFEYRLTFTF